ncbi:PD40 domain-containing protein [Candidatus Poribacteria bacterium]|nr:PD40 domain-containing protein [Candidatus Poribacteria bacterium]
MLRKRGDTVNVTNHAANDGRPAWSPDGGDIAFVSDRDGNAEIYLMKPNGSNVRRLTEDMAVDTDPAWVSEGQLLFSSNRVRDFEVYIMTRDGSNPIRVTLSLGINIQPNAGLQ